MLSGSKGHFTESDIRYIHDLGLIQRKPHLTIANRIYMEVLPRQIVAPVQDVLAYRIDQFINADRKLNTSKLFIAFQQLFIERFGEWQELAVYGDAQHLLLFQAFLQRIVDNNGRIRRRYGLSQGYVDILVTWPLDPSLKFRGPTQTISIILKFLQKDLDDTLKMGLNQAVGHANMYKSDEMHVLIFHSDNRQWSERIWHKQKILDKRVVYIWGC